jgi:cellulose synthase/poly-beta-1,6-N-acetylglucosamine synthase-like glycosyltransferase
MNLVICAATLQDRMPADLQGIIDKAWTRPAVQVRYNTPESNLGVVGSYQRLYELSTGDILFYVHDDVIIHEDGWDMRFLQEFTDPAVGIVGFGGALCHGDPNIYKTPYRLQQLGRFDYRSNVDDAETHGMRFTGSCDVAVLDGYTLGVRRSLLDGIGGWKLLINARIDFIAYDYALCALAHRHGYRIRLLGISCHHRGGATSVRMNIDRRTEYEYSHRWLYDNFRDVLPWQCLNLQRRSH